MEVQQDEVNALTPGTLGGSIVTQWVAIPSSVCMLKYIITNTYDNPFHARLHWILTVILWSSLLSWFCRSGTWMLRRLKWWIRILQPRNGRARISNQVPLRPKCVLSCAMCFQISLSGGQPECVAGRHGASFEKKVSPCHNHSPSGRARDKC